MDIGDVRDGRKPRKIGAYEKTRNNIAEYERLLEPFEDHGDNTCGDEDNGEVEKERRQG